MTRRTRCVWAVGRLTLAGMGAISFQEEDREARRRGGAGKRDPAEWDPGAGRAHRTGVVAAHASFFILKQFLEILDKADGDDDY